LKASSAAITILMLMMIKIAANNAGLLPRWKIIAALSTSIITAADTLDYLMEPIFSVPLIGDIPDSFLWQLFISLQKEQIIYTH
jgi:hypothetical protein